MHGSYFALDCGSVADALVDLTGGVVTKVKLDSDEGKELVSSGALWTRMMLYCSWGYVMAAVCKDKSAADDAVAAGGLLCNHVYGVIDCRVLADGSHIVRVHNPWPSGDWHGAWSMGAREWDHPGAHHTPSVVCFAMYRGATGPVVRISDELCCSRTERGVLCARASPSAPNCRDLRCTQMSRRSCTSYRRRSRIQAPSGCPSQTSHAPSHASSSPACSHRRGISSRCIRVRLV